MIAMIYLLLASISSLATIILSAFGSYVFSRKEFEKKKIYKYLSANSTLDAFIFVILFFFSFSQYYKFYDHKYSYLYFVVFCDYYIGACFSSVLKTASTYLNIVICFYRLLQITSLKNLNKKFKFEQVITLIVLLSIITTLPIFGLGTITTFGNTNESYYKRVKNNFTIYGYYLNDNIVTGRRIHNIICLTLIILPNIYILAYLLKFRQEISRRLNERNSSIVLDDQGIINQVQTTTSLSVNSLNNELKMSLVVILISIICVCDLLYKLVSQYFYFIRGGNHMEPIVVLFAHLSTCLLNSANILVYYLFNDAFKRKSKICLHLLIAYLCE